jgi:nucleoid-associated protein EbfC
MIRRPRYTNVCLLSLPSLVAALLAVLATFPNSVAFQLNSESSAAVRQRTRNTPSVTALPIMNWFGSNKDGDGKAQNPDALSVDNNGALGGVAGIMDSMDSFKKSQRIGKMTGALVQELSSTIVEGVAENGKVKVLYDCQQRPVSTFIDESFFEANEASDVAAAITTAMKDAYVKSSEKMDDKMKNFFNEIGLSSSN